MSICAAHAGRQAMRGAPAAVVGLAILDRAIVKRKLATVVVDAAAVFVVG